MEREPLAQRVRNRLSGPGAQAPGVVVLSSEMPRLAPRPSAEGSGSPAEKRAYLARVEEAASLVAHGRELSAVVLSRETSDRRFNGAQIIVVELEIDDPVNGGPRIVSYDHVFGPATARSWKPGREIRIWIDPRDPMRIYAGR